MEKLHTFSYVSSYIGITYKECNVDQDSYIRSYIVRGQ